jgi:ferrous iron transport protein A
VEIAFNNIKMLQNIKDTTDITGGELMKTLKQAKIGDTVKIVKLHGEGAVKRRIMDMGITKGVEVHIRKVAPLGDPIEVTVRGYELSIRKADAEMIEVE